MARDPLSTGRRAPGSFRAIVRFVGAVLATSGVLLLGDVGLTLAWQEPVSAFLASRGQADLRADLKSDLPAVRRDLADVAAVRDPQARLAELAQRSRRRARTGRGVGEIRFPTLDRRATIVQGTDSESLRKGPGHYPATGFPGEGRTVGVAGHRTTYGAPFRPLNELKRGDTIIADMPYGRFTYSVEKTRIVLPTATWVVRDVPGPERLVLTACHPLYSAARRIVVFARLNAGEGMLVAPTED